MIMHTKWTISAAVIFLLRVSVTMIYWHSRNDLSRLNVIAAVVVCLVYLVFLALTCKPARHTMSRTRRYLIDIAFLTGSVTVLRLLEYSPWATTFVFLGTAEDMVLSNTGISAVNCRLAVALQMTLYLMKYRDWGVAALLGLCKLFQTLKHVNGWLGCKSICGFGWLMLKGFFGELRKRYKSVYDFLDNKEEKALLESWAQDLLFREANPDHPMFQDYDDSFLRRIYGQPPK